MRKGLFISVDGPNGAGKTTFIRTLVENLSVNYDVYDTREPSLNSTPFVRQYDILFNKWGVLLCQKEYQTNDIRRNSREWL